jgi:hypothetical protein
VLVVHPRHAGLMSGEEARQLIRRNDEVDAGDDEQDDAKHGQYQLHGSFLLDKGSFFKGLFHLFIAYARLSASS